MADVIVVGGGLGGLAAALEIAARGRQVCVLEAEARPGGKAGVVTIDGVEMDTGPSVLTLPDVLDRLFARAGTKLRDELTLIEPNPAFRYHYADGASVDVFVSPEATLASVRQAFGAQAEAELRDFLAYTATIWNASADTFVLGPQPTVGAMFQMGLASLSIVAKLDSLRSMWRAICSKVKDPHLRMLLARYATYNGSDVRTAPATLNCIAHVELALGGFGIAGGIYQLVRALVRNIERLGGEVRCGAPVRRIVVEGGRACGVETDREVISANAVICNADVAHLTGALLPPNTRHGLPTAPTLSMSGWNAIARCQRGPRVAHTVLFPADYLAEFADLFDRDRPPEVPTVYLCAQAAAHHNPGWPDAEPVFLMANAPPEPADHPRDPACWAQLRATVLERLRAAALLGPSDAVIWERTPADLASLYPGSRGAIYGASSNSRWAAFARAANRSALPGLYVCGGGAHPGGGMPLCIQSGRIAAEQLLADLG